QQGGQKFTLSIAMAGSGKGSVRLADGTVACPGTCSAVGDAGSPIRLEAVADAGSHFLGWSGACSGSGSCEVSLARDSSVTATFDKGAGRPRLIVAINGSGGVKSDPAGIDCGATCVAQFDSGTRVRLIPTAAQGFAFVGWGGGCSGAAPCGVAIDGDVQVWATFAPVEPADECDGFMPASVPAPVDAVIAGETCVRGLSDDGDGNYLLNTFKSGNVGGNTFHFFQVRNGSARDTGNTQLGPAMGGTSLHPHRQERYQGRRRRPGRPGGSIRGRARVGPRRQRAGLDRQRRPGPWDAPALRPLAELDGRTSDRLVRRRRHLRQEPGPGGGL